ncbi:MAG: serine/threonine-protein kinase [Streptosporangiaceae bacterium]
MPESKPLLPGDPVSIGGYRLTGRLGEGGQGVVFMGSGPAGDNVAVKLLQAHLDDGARHRFVRELESTKRVARFCTAQVLDADVDGDRPFIVSEYVAGPSLAGSVSDNGVLTGGSLERLAIGTLTALVAIHQAGVIHRDFKPHNVILGEDGPRVIDFGIAKALDASSTQVSGVIGTPAYMAPEQIEGKQVGTPADIFAWGLTMAFAANGRPPFGQDSIPAIIGRILQGHADLGTMSGPVRDLVQSALSKDPARRPTAKELLLLLLGGGTVPTVTPGEPPTALLAMGEDRAGLPTDPGQRDWNVPGAYVPPPYDPTPQPFGQTPQPYGQNPQPYGQTTPGGPSLPSQQPARRSVRRGLVIAVAALAAVLLLVGGTVLALDRLGDDRSNTQDDNGANAAPTGATPGESAPGNGATTPTQSTSAAPQQTKPAVGRLACTDTGARTLGAAEYKSGIGLDASGGAVHWTASLAGPGRLSASQGDLAASGHVYISLTLSQDERATAGSSTISVTAASGGSCTRQISWSALPPVVTPTSPPVTPTSAPSTPPTEGEGE